MYYFAWFEGEKMARREGTRREFFRMLTESLWAWWRLQPSRRSSWEEVGRDRRRQSGFDTHLGLIVSRLFTIGNERGDNVWVEVQRSLNLLLVSSFKPSFGPTSYVNHRRLPDNPADGNIERILLWEGCCMRGWKARTLKNGVSSSPLSKDMHLLSELAFFVRYALMTSTQDYTSTLKASCF